MKLSPSNRLLFAIALRNWLWILGTVILSFWSGIFNGVSIALLVPGILAFLGRKIDLGAFGSAPKISLSGPTCIQVRYYRLSDA